VRRQPTLEWQVPPEPAALYTVRAIQALAVFVLLHWGLEWALVWWGDVLMDGALGTAGLSLGAALFAFLGRAKLPKAPSWALRVDGEGWHWAREDGLRCGSGAIDVAAAFGGWCLLRATARQGHGQSAWIWLRPSRLRSLHGAACVDAPNVRDLAGTRLRTALNWP
jgi:hypothetical protein